MHRRGAGAITVYSIDQGTGAQSLSDFPWPGRGRKGIQPPLSTCNLGLSLSLAEHIPCSLE